MQITLSTGNWADLSALLADAKRASNSGDNVSREDEDEEDALFARLHGVLKEDPITAGFDSYNYNFAFGEVFMSSEGKIPSADFESLGRFIASFCPSIGEDGRRFAVPMDAHLGALEWYAVMSPKTLRDLIPLPERIDRRAFRSAVRAALSPGTISIESVGDYFDYLGMWTRAYRLAAAEERGAAVMLG